MVRFLHTADWQLGMKGGSLGKAGEIVRRARIETTRAMISMASEEKVNFILIAGDLFESNAVHRDTIEQALDVFDKASGIPIYILPGNHDPLEPDSVYLQRIWKSSPGNVRVLTERNPVKLGKFNTILYPCPLRQKQSRADPTAWISGQDTEQIRIGVAHGTLDIGLTKEPNFPINPHRAEESGLDYLALGDWHSLFIHKDSSGVPRTAYPGTPEGTGFDERDPGHALVVELERGGEPQIKAKDCAQLKWMIWEEHIHSRQDIQALIRKTRKLGEPGNTLLKLRIEGNVDIETYNMVEELTQLRRDLLYLDIDSDKLRLRPSVKDMVGVVTEGTWRKVAESLEALLSREPGFAQLAEVPPEELERRLREIQEWRSQDKLKLRDVDPAIIERALSLLYQFSKEVVE